MYTGPIFTLRPFHLVDAVCASGEAEPPADPTTAALLELLRTEPDTPLLLRCHTGDIYSYQDPDDPAGSSECERYQDLEILHLIDLFPGTVLPARIIMYRVFLRLDDLDTVCAPADATSATWAGCGEALRTRYASGRALGIDALIPPRPAEEMVREKAASIAAMEAADPVAVRPHILLCAVCQIGQDLLPPYPEDNLPELLQLILREPERRLTMAPGADWMMCAPCPYRTAHGMCVIHQGKDGLGNQYRDLRILRRLDLAFGDTLTAREFFRLLLTRIPGTLSACTLRTHPGSVWHDPCSNETEDSVNYTRGRAILLEALGLNAE